MTDRCFRIFQRPAHALTALEGKPPEGLGALPLLCGHTIVLIFAPEYEEHSGQNEWGDAGSSHSTPKLPVPGPDLEGDQEGKGSKAHRRILTDTSSPHNTSSLISLARVQ